MIPQITLERSGLRISQLSLGTAQLHNCASRKARVRLLKEAFDLGITHFDTAPLYGDGSAEEALGIAAKGNRCNITIATKFGLTASRWLGRLGATGLPLYLARSVLARRGLISWPKRDFAAPQMSKSLNESLTALQTDYLDIFFLHEPWLEDLESNEELLKRLSAEKTSGRIRHIGLAGGEFGPILSRYGDLFDVIQADEGGWEDRQFVPDITYSAISARRDLTAKEAIRNALTGPPGEAVLFGTHRIDHLRESADLLITAATHARS